MAFDNFLGWELTEKVRMLRALQEARLTGRISQAMTANNIGTRFDLSETSITMLLRELEQSIASDPDFDASDPFQAACASSIRPATTRTSH